ncbi:hypothetical protein ACFOYW_17490 [Gryllotalpicola reticulitermitis]|uniref:FXSXX-COOH protein n=1 Tax=Gryllotalpicola reticulitermitis TaxID=1184153 RepID=A0ABV8QCC2_9MICO
MSWPPTMLGPAQNEMEPFVALPEGLLEPLFDVELLPLPLLQALRATTDAAAIAIAAILTEPRRRGAWLRPKTV